MISSPLPSILWTNRRSTRNRWFSRVLSIKLNEKENWKLETWEKWGKSKLVFSVPTPTRDLFDWEKDKYWHRKLSLNELAMAPEESPKKNICRVCVDWMRKFASREAMANDEIDHKSSGNLNSTTKNNFWVAWTLFSERKSFRNDFSQFNLLLFASTTRFRAAANFWQLCSPNPLPILGMTS